MVLFLHTQPCTEYDAIYNISGSSHWHHIYRNVSLLARCIWGSRVRSFLLRPFFICIPQDHQALASLPFIPLWSAWVLRRRRAPAYRNAIGAPHQAIPMVGGLKRLKQGMVALRKMSPKLRISLIKRGGECASELPLPARSIRPQKVAHTYRAGAIGPVAEKIPNIGQKATAPALTRRRKHQGAVARMDGSPF